MLLRKLKPKEFLNRKSHVEKILENVPVQLTKLSQVLERG